MNALNSHTSTTPHFSFSPPRAVDSLNFSSIMFLPSARWTFCPMSWIRRYSSGNTHLLQFSLTKQHFALFICGVFIMLAASFSLGIVVAKKRVRTANYYNLATSGGSEAAVKITPRNSLKGRTARASESSTIEPGFYGDLLGKKKPGAEKLPPLKLSTSPTSGPSRENKPKDSKPNRQQPASKPSLPARPQVITLELSTTPRFTIQVATVKKPAYAIRIHQNLRGKGYAVFIKRVDLKGKGEWLRIYIGRVINKNTATRALRDLHVKTVIQGGKIVRL